MYDKDIILELKDLTKVYRSSDSFFKNSGTEFKAVDKACLSIKRGRSLGIVGESGSGKTTLVKMISDIIKPDFGKILYNGQEINSLNKDEYKKFRQNIQMVFQDPYSSLNPKLTIYSTLKDGISRAFNFNKTELREYCVKLMNKVGLKEEHLDRYPHEFSGGQRQRVSIARALSLKPDVIIADEPVSSLDVSVQSQILNLLKSLSDEGVTFILISHDLAIVAFLCEETAVMKDGKILEYNKTDFILKNPENEYTLSLLNASH